MPRFLAKVNAKGSPVAALLITTGLIQLLLILLLFVSDALDFMLDLTAALSLIPYLLAAGYALKLTVTRETYDDRRSLRTDMVIGAVAAIYTAFLVYAAGFDHLLLSCILYAPAAVLYVVARREQNLRVFTCRRGGVVRSHRRRRDRRHRLAGHRSDHAMTDPESGRELE